MFFLCMVLWALFESHQCVSYPLSNQMKPEKYTMDDVHHYASRNLNPLLQFQPNEFILYGFENGCDQFELVKVYEHDKKAFTEGLVWYDEKMYESSGRLGTSEILIADLSSGKVLQRAALPTTVFGEGITILNDTIYQLTWHKREGLTWNATTLEPLGSFNYKTLTGEGWGLTSDTEHLIMSDGSSLLSFFDPVTYSVVRSVPVTLHGVHIPLLNELEYVNDTILANVWSTNNVLRIDPVTGNVTTVYNFSKLYAEDLRDHELDDIDAVFNGIAYNNEEDILYLTGKLWPRLYAVRLLC